MYLENNCVSDLTLIHYNYNYNFIHYNNIIAREIWIFLMGISGDHTSFIARCFFFYGKGNEESG